MRKKHYLVYAMAVALIIGTSYSSCLANVRGQENRASLAVQRQPAGDITKIQEDLSQIRTILKKVLKTDMNRQIKLTNLRMLSAKEKKPLRDRIQLTLKKNAYDFIVGDMENLTALSQAINVNQAIIIKNLLRSRSAEFPAEEKRQINQAIGNILTFSKVIYSRPSNEQQRKAVQTMVPPGNDLSEEDLMQPILSEARTFDYQGRTANQLTPVAMCFVDLEFFKQTGGGENALQRNVGALKLLLLAYAQILKGFQVHLATDDEKEKLADLLLNDELKSLADEDKTLTNEKINQIYDRVRQKILAKVTPQANCQKIRKKFGLE